MLSGSLYIRLDNTELRYGVCATRADLEICLQKVFYLIPAVHDADERDPKNVIMGMVFHPATLCWDTICEYFQVYLTEDRRAPSQVKCLAGANHYRVPLWFGDLLKFHFGTSSHGEQLMEGIPHGIPVRSWKQVPLEREIHKKIYCMANTTPVGDIYNELPDPCFIVIQTMNPLVRFDYSDETSLGQLCKGLFCARKIIMTPVSGDEDDEFSEFVIYLGGPKPRIVYRVPKGHECIKCTKNVA